MKICLFHLMAWPYLAEPPRTYPVSGTLFDPHKAPPLYRDYLDQMTLAEELGFDWVACNEHHFTPYGLMTNAALVGAALSQRTRSVRLAMMGALLPLSNPVRVAEEFAMLDCMSGGRLVAGFLRGVPREYLAYHANPAESRERFEEAWNLILRCWTEPEPFAWEGRYYRFPSVSIWPRPVQQPHPPIYMSDANEVSVRFAVQHRSGIALALVDAETAQRQFGLYRRLAADDGWTPNRDLFFWEQLVYVEPRGEAARAALRFPQEYFWRYSMGPSGMTAAILASGQRRAAVEAGPRADHEPDKHRMDARMSLDEQIERGFVACGSPDEVVEQLRERIRASVCGVLNTRFHVGTLTHEQVTASMRLFMQEVWPHLQDL